jgi:Spy/CpxP family protein refolding chaperone
MKTSTKILSVVSALALSATVAFAAPQAGDGQGKGFGHRHGHGKMGFMARGLGQKLNLTDEQKATWQASSKAFREENKAFFQAARETHKEMKAAKEANDTAKLESLKATAQSQRAQMKQLRDQQEAKFVSILTAEQKAQFDQLKADRAARRAAHEGREHQQQ